VVADKAKEKKLTVKRNKHLTNNEHRALSHAVELDKNKRVASVEEFIFELSKPKRFTSYLKSPSVKTLDLTIIALFFVGLIYTLTNVKTDETTSTQQANHVDKYKIDNILKQANSLMMSDESEKQSKNEALSLYLQVLKLDPNNSHAKSGIEKLKEIYFAYIKNAIHANELKRASELLKALEGYFSNQAEWQHLNASLNRHLISNQIELLVKKAAQEELDEHYIRPVNKNAYDTYLEILELSPEETRALQGIERIRKQIVNEAEIMVHNEQWEKAESMINDALLISPESDDASAVLSKIKAQRLSGRYEYLEKNIAQSGTVSSSSSQQRLIQLHTNLAQKFINGNKLYGPGNNNAAYHFRRILTIDPSNEYAKKGLNNAWITLIDNIKRNVELNNFSDNLDTIEESIRRFSPFYDVEGIISDLATKRAKVLTKGNWNHDIKLRLSQAKIQLEADRLIEPKGNNALELYLEVKKIDPDNMEAISGIAIVENKISSLIRSYINSEQLSKANEMLRNSLEIFPQSKKLYDLKLFMAKSNTPTVQNSHRLFLSKQITELSNSAIVALSRKRYIFPVGRSAYDFYSRITSLESGSNIGIQGRNEAKQRAYDQIESDIREKNYQIAILRINRLSKLGVREDRLVSLQTKLSNADQSYNKALSNKNIPNNHLIYLLKFAHQQENKGVIWPPLSNNAYGVYKHVHDIEPLNKTARESLSKLFNSRISSIKELLDSYRLHEAELEIQALDKLYNGKKEKEIISLTVKKLVTLKSKNKQL
jgi:hypothetical protein